MMVQQGGHTGDLHYRIGSRIAGAIPLCAVRQAFIVVAGNHGMMPDGWHSRWRAGEGSANFSLFLFCSLPPYSCSVLRTVPASLFLPLSRGTGWPSASYIFLYILLSLSFALYIYIYISISFGTYTRIISIFVLCLVLFLYDISDSSSRPPHFIFQRGFSKIIYFLQKNKTIALIFSKSLDKLVM